METVCVAGVMLHLRDAVLPCLAIAAHPPLPNVMNTGLFSGDISQALGLGNSLADRAENALIVAVIGLPGYYLSVAFLEKIGRKRLQLGGFAAIAVLFFIIGGGFDGLRKVGALLLILYGMTFLFSNFGPNATTYIIPGLSFLSFFSIHPHLTPFLPPPSPHQQASFIRPRCVQLAMGFLQQQESLGLQWLPTFFRISRAASA